MLLDPIDPKKGPRNCPFCSGSAAFKTDGPRGWACPHCHGGKDEAAPPASHAIAQRLHDWADILEGFWRKYPPEGNVSVDRMKEGIDDLRAGAMAILREGENPRYHKCATCSQPFIGSFPVPVLCEECNRRALRQTVVTAERVMALRVKTGAGLMDCRAALERAENEEEAIDMLRLRGTSRHHPGWDRPAREGPIDVTPLPAAVALLREMEWGGTDDQHFKCMGCPVCRGAKPGCPSYYAKKTGHKPDCKLAAFLVGR